VDEVPACSDINSELCAALATVGELARRAVRTCQVGALTAAGCDIDCGTETELLLDGPSGVPSTATTARAGLRPVTRLRIARLHRQGLRVSPRYDLLCAAGLGVRNTYFRYLRHVVLCQAPEGDPAPATACRSVRSWDLLAMA
jgi:hypothetical protein